MLEDDRLDDIVRVDEAVAEELLEALPLADPDAVPFTLLLAVVVAVTDLVATPVRVEDDVLDPDLDDFIVNEELEDAVGVLLGAAVELRRAVALDVFVLDVVEEEVDVPETVFVPAELLDAVAVAEELRDRRVLTVATPEADAVFDEKALGVIDRDDVTVRVEEEDVVAVRDDLTDVETSAVAELVFVPTALRVELLL